MNKHSVIVIIASIAIAGTVGFSVLNTIIADQIQLRPSTQETFSYFSLMNEEKVSICNPAPFYAIINGIKISMVYEGRTIGTLEFPRATIEPNSEIKKEGEFTTETFEEVQYMAMHFDGMFMDTIPPRIDQSRMEIITEVQTLILGLIPYSITNHYQGLEFWEMMNGDIDEYRCL